MSLKLNDMPADENAPLRTVSPKLADAIMGNGRDERRKEAKAKRHRDEEAQRKHEEARAKLITSTFQTLPADERKKYSELVKIVPNGYGYTCYQRIDAIFAYFVEGTIRGAARLIGMSEGTILSWAQSSWWKAAIQKVRELKADELDVQYTKIIDKTLEHLEDRLENGDERVTKMGEIVKVAVGARDLMVINAMAYDKRALQRGDPTAINGKTELTADDRNKALADQFRKIAKGESIIEGEIEPVEQEAPDAEDELPE